MDERGADAGVVSNYQLRELDMSSDQQQSRWMRLGGTSIRGSDGQLCYSDVSEDNSTVCSINTTDRSICLEKRTMIIGMKQRS